MSTAYTLQVPGFRNFVHLDFYLKLIVNIFVAQFTQ